MKHCLFFILRRSMKFIRPDSKLYSFLLSLLNRFPIIKRRLANFLKPNIQSNNDLGTDSASLTPRARHIHGQLKIALASKDREP